MQSHEIPPDGQPGTSLLDEQCSSNTGICTVMYHAGPASLAFWRACEMDALTILKFLGSCSCGLRGAEYVDSEVYAFEANDQALRGERECGWVRKAGQQRKGEQTITD